MASKPRRQRNSTGLPIQLGPSSLTSIFRPKKTEEPPRGRPDLYASLTDLRPVRRKVQLVSHPGQVRQRRHLYLPDDLAAVDFYSNLADANVVRDLLVEAASHHQGHHLTLAGGERLKVIQRVSWNSADQLAVAAGP
jgi:hypothetical protein